MEEKNIATVVQEGVNKPALDTLYSLIHSTAVKVQKLPSQIGEYLIRPKRTLDYFSIAIGLITGSTARGSFRVNENDYLLFLFPAGIRVVYELIELAFPYSGPSTEKVNKPGKENLKPSALWAIVRGGSISLLETYAAAMLMR